jgi:hypothetical protein
MINKDFTLWYDTYDMSFVELNLRSRVPKKWMKYQNVINGRYSDTIIKPINRYVEILYPMPDLVDISNNTIRLRQRNHADFYLLVSDEGIPGKRGNFYNVDRPHLRQYYQTKEAQVIPEGCFDGTYKFYVPWFIDQEVEVLIEQPKDEESPFFIYSKSFLSKKIPASEEFIEPEFVTFHFKKAGPHMEAEDFGVIYKKTAMFDIVFQADDIMIERVRDFYEHYPVLPI